MVSSGLLQTLDASRKVEIFEITGEDRMRLSIESWENTNERLPVVFCFGGLEISHALKVETLTTAADFVIYEQNPVRTRMRLAGTAKQVLLKIDRERERAEFYLGNSPLALNKIRVNFKETSFPGLYELIFSGRGIYTYTRFLFEAPTGTIYSLPVHISIGDFNPDLSCLWAITVNGRSPDFEKGGVK
jgi:hypothetical protein